MCNVEVNRLDPDEIAAGFTKCTEIRTDVEEIIRRMAQFINATLVGPIKVFFNGKCTIGVASSGENMAGHDPRVRNSRARSQGHRRLPAVWLRRFRDS